MDEWRQRYKKPVVLDEICYEGNIEHGWGNISGQELVRRFWEAACRGGYVAMVRHMLILKIYYGGAMVEIFTEKALRGLNSCTRFVRFRAMD